MGKVMDDDPRAPIRDWCVYKPGVGFVHRLTADEVAALKRKHVSRTTEEVWLGRMSADYRRIESK